MPDRWTAVAAAVVVETFVYTLAWIADYYDDPFSVLFVPIVGGFFSVLFVGVGLLLGLILRIPFLARRWTATPLWAALVTTVSVSVLVFGYSAGLTYVGTDAHTGEEVVTLHPPLPSSVGTSSFFSVANWPIRRTTRAFE